MNIIKVPRPDSVSAQPAVAQPKSKRATHRRVTMAAAALCAVAASWLVWTVVASSDTSARNIRALAVLPCANQSANKEQTEYQSDGLAEGLITALGRIEGLRVPGRTSSFRFRDAERDVGDIGRQLDVEAILECTWWLDGKSVRVTARLIGTANGDRFWENTYDGESRDPLALQDTIVAAIVKELAIQLGASEVARLTSRPTQSGEAYDLYLRGRYFGSSARVRGFSGRSSISTRQPPLTLDSPWRIPAWLIRTSFAE